MVESQYRTASTLRSAASAGRLEPTDCLALTRGKTPGRQAALPERPQSLPMGLGAAPQIPGEGVGAHRPAAKAGRCWLAEEPAGRFEFVFTPKHGSWLNLIEGFFSKLTRSVLRQMLATSASHPSRNSRTVTWLPSITSIVTLLSTPGCTTLIELLIGSDPWKRCSN